MLNFLLTYVKYEVAKYETEPVRKVTQVNPAASRTNDLTPAEWEKYLGDKNQFKTDLQYISDLTIKCSHC